MPEAIHIKLDQSKLEELLKKGNKELVQKLQLFHSILYSIDADWPYVDTPPFGYWKGKVCVECGGRSYRNPSLKPAEIKALIRQLKVPIKIRRFALERKCMKGGKDPIYQRPVSDGYYGDYN